MPQTIQERVKQVIVEQLGCTSDEVHPSTRLFEDLEADSLDQIELVMQLEESFGISIPDSDVESLGTVQQIVDYVERKRVN